MRLLVLVPTGIVLDEPVRKVVAEAEDGWFCLEPRHAAFVAALVPGVLRYETEADREVYLGVDRGALVKCGPEVRVSVRTAVPGTDLAALEAAVRAQVSERLEAEEGARGALARLEAGALRRFLRSEERGP
jgi:F-type H+-transporting ATPase subunit epsilon